MVEQPEKRFSFVSSALAADAFTVVRFRGEEGLSRCYRFEIELASADPAVDVDAVISSPAVLSIIREKGDIPFHGIVAEFEQLRQAGVYTFYRAVLVPKLWWLSMTHHNQVFLGQTVPQMVEACLKDGGLTSLDFELRLQKACPPWDFACQYRESHLNFVSRWLERQGIYYYFEQGSSGEKAVITDTRIAHGPMPQGTAVRYRALAALEHFHREEVVWEARSRQQLVPQYITLRDYNYETPSLELAGFMLVSAKGRGEVYLYGEHFLTPEEAQALAQVRAEEFLCREKQLTGESGVPYLRPGYTFQLEDHYRESLNQPYLTVSLAHEGSQAAYLLAGLGVPLAPGEEEPYYRNRFTAIPASAQFRPERKAEKPRFYGSLPAKVDAAGSGQYAELDDLGRYKVILPFDMSGRKDGKASAWLRMMQPYAGSDHGMHLPLHKGTEVLLTFIDGDPDRPVIAGAVPNPATPSPVTGGNQTMAVLQTSGQNKIAMEDREGSQRILLQTPVANSWVRLGAPNDPPTAPTPTPTPSRPVPPTPTPTPTATPTPTPTPTETEKKDDDDHHKTEDGIYVYTDGPWHLVGAKADVQILGESFEFVLGTSQIIICGNEAKVKLISSVDVTLGWNLEWKMGHTLGVGEHTEWKMSHQGFHLEKVDVEGSVQKLAGEVAHLAGQTSMLAGDVSTIAGETSHLSAGLSHLAGQTSTLAGVVEDMNGTVERLSGEQSLFAGADIQTVTAQTRVIVQDMATKVDEMNVVVDSTNTIAERTDIAGENTVLAGLNTLI